MESIKYRNKEPILTCYGSYRKVSENSLFGPEELRSGDLLSRVAFTVHADIHFETIVYENMVWLKATTLKRVQTQVSWLASSSSVRDGKHAFIVHSS